MGTEGRVALGALPLARLVAAAHTLKAEDVEALGEHGVFLASVTAGAGQPRLDQTDRQTDTMFRATLTVSTL